MDIKDYDFHLPEELIAQTPLQDRTASRLLVLNREARTMEHRHFADIGDYLKPGDCLVLNDTRVLPARLYGIKKDTQAKVEILLLKQMEGDSWEVLVKPAKKVKVGTELSFGDGKLTAVCKELLEHGGRIIEFKYDGIFYEVLEELGEMPLPPYIKEQLPDQERYQTVYAKEKALQPRRQPVCISLRNCLRIFRKKALKLHSSPFMLGWEPSVPSVWNPSKNMKCMPSFIKCPRKRQIS